MMEASVLGAGLAGCEAAWQLAERGVKVELWEMKPQRHSPAHISNNYGELVCSNSLRSDELTNAVGLLKEKGLVEQPYYGDITLTESGYEYAQAVYKRHRYLTAFLSKQLGIPEDVAEDEACLMEHAISDESFKKWVTYIEELGIVDTED